MRQYLGLKEYPDMIRAHKKDPMQMVADLHPLKIEVLHNAIELATSAGDLLSCIKKCSLYGDKLDIQTIMDELGNLEFSLEQLRQVLDIKRDAILINNMAMVQNKYKQEQKK